jgi:hypothetical protein
MWLVPLLILLISLAVLSMGNKTWTQSDLIDTSVDKIENFLIDMEKNYASLFPEHHRSFTYITRTPISKTHPFISSKNLMVLSTQEMAQFRSMRPASIWPGKVAQGLW